VSRWLQTESPVENTQLYKNREGGREREREREWATWEINREERGRVCGDGPGGSRQKPD
jgi:hypothetical protein